LTLRIRPIKLKQSIYFRVPNDIADLIGIEPQDEVTLTLKEDEKEFLLTYSVMKGPSSPKPVQPEVTYENSSRHLTTLARTAR
jgi:hypothetical protein